MPAKKAQKAHNGSIEETQSETRYEEGVAELEALVERMEEGELSLEETLAAYERGTALFGRLEALLKRGEKRVEMLASQNGEEKRVPFETEPEPLAFALEEE